MTASQIKSVEFSYPGQAATTQTRLGRTDTYAIVASDVNMVFQSGSERFQVLQNINLEIQQGDVQLLMGPSGSGKTTLLSILAGMLTPTSGSVRVLGREITTLNRHQLAQFRLDKIGFIFQGFNLFPALTAVENVEVALQIKGVAKAELYDQAMTLLEQVNLEGKANFLPRDLSGGQKQRVAIARALAGDPRIIMADEPTASLDSHNGHAITELLRRLAKEAGRTVLIVTHDPRLVDVADRVTYLEDGILRS